MLSACASLTEFFRDALGSALRNQHVSVTEQTEFYLVNLLAHFTHLPVNDEPLGVKLAQAATQSPEERLAVLRDVGDHSLYVSGLFGDSLERKHVDVDYYVTLGGSAYHQLACHVRYSKDIHGQIFAELSQKFGDCVEVLAEVGVGTHLSSSSLVQLYERLRRTGSAWTERKLREAGMVPRRGESS